MRYRVEKVPKGQGTDVFFAFTLKGVAERAESETIGQSLWRSAQFVRALFTPELDVGYELLAYNAGTGNIPAVLMLRVRVSGFSETDAMDKARTVAAGLNAALSLGKRWQWMPAEVAGADAFPPFQGELGLYTINRRAVLIERAVSDSHEFDALANTPGQNPGHGIFTQQGAVRMSVYPFLPQADPIGRIMRLLSSSGCAAAVSIAIAPVKLYAREEQLLAEEELAENDLTEESEIEQNLSSYKARLTLRESAFMLRVCFCTAQGALAEMLAQNVGASLSGPESHSRQAGGFEVRRVGALEVQSALADLRRIGFSSKPPKPDVAGWERLPYLVSAVEAGMLFRFPARPCPGVPQNRPMAAFLSTPAATGTLIGTAVTSGGGQISIHITPEDRLRHMYVVGQTGTGKSSLMLSVMLQDFKEDQGGCLLDFHGDLYSRCLANLPESRRKDVIAFDCSLPEPGFSFNLLEHSTEQERDRIVENFLEIFGQLFDLKLVGGPVFEMYFRTALTLVMYDPKATLADFFRFFYDRDYRVHCIGLCKDAFVSAAWEKIVATTGGDLSLSNVAPYIVSKLSPFLYNKQTRGIVSCRKTTLDFNAAVRERKIILVNLAKGSIGNLAASFIGMLFTEKVLRAAMHPGNVQQPGRNFYIYVDEFQNIATPNFAELLSEARKNQLGAVLAHQFLGQLPAGVLQAALGNAGSLLCMRVGPKDADILAEFFQPAFSKADLLRLPVGAAAVSMLSAGEKPQPFLLSTSNGLALTHGASIPPSSAPAPVRVKRVRGKRAHKRTSVPDVATLPTAEGEIGPSGQIDC